MPAYDPLIQRDHGIADGAFFDLSGGEGGAVECYAVITELVVMRVSHIYEENRVRME